jgi:flagellar assembly factor FliW
MTTVTETTMRVHLLEPLPGFDGEEYTLDPIDEQGLLHSLRSVTDPELRFVLAAAPAFFPDYAPAISSTLAGPLGADEVDLLLVLTIGAGLRDATANLRAPIALARSTGRAVQVVLDDPELSMRAPLRNR